MMNVNENIHSHTLCNKFGMQVEILDLGARVSSKRSFN